MYTKRFASDSFMIDNNNNYLKFNFRTPLTFISIRLQIQEEICLPIIQHEVQWSPRKSSRWGQP